MRRGFRWREADSIILLTDRRGGGAVIPLSLILVHLAGDFYFQTNKMAERKAKYLRLHLIHHLLLNVAALILIALVRQDHRLFLHVIAPAALLVLLHDGVDRLKIALSRWRGGRSLYRLHFFTFDQCLHLLSILLVCTLFLDFRPTEALDRLVGVLQDGSNPELSPFASLLFLIVMLIVATTVSGHFIRILVGIIPDQLSLSEGRYVLRNLHADQNRRLSKGRPQFDETYTYLVNKRSSRSRGVLIGYLERLLIIVLVLIDAVPGIAFIVAAKSIARFKQLDDRDFAEYFLLGTLASVFLGLMYGLLIRWVLF